jgi:hypothetical protein
MKMVSPDAQELDLPMHREAVEEELRLRDALKRIRLEDVAKSPILSSWGWVSKVAIGICIFMPYLSERYQWYVNGFVIIYLIAGERLVHARIDAILELAELDKRRPKPLTNTKNSIS